MHKTQNNAAWLLVLPVFVIVAFSAIIPLMTVVNYAFQDILGPQDRVWVGTDWFAEVLADEDLHGAALRQLVFSLTILAIQIPLFDDKCKNECKTTGKPFHCVCSPCESLSM